MPFCFHGKPYVSLDIKEEVQIDNNIKYVI